MNGIKSVAILMLLLSLLVHGVQASAQGTEELQYFPDTGHNVRGDFLQFYKNAQNPVILYGYPITEQFTSKDGRTVQYFQRARFELDANESVQHTLLGSAVYEPGSQRLDINNPSACETFETGYSVCFAFLDFYSANGGRIQFGSPISPFEFHENLIVQYFEKARFEWRADRPEGERVVLTDLGRLYFDRLGEDPASLRPIRPLDAIIAPILSIHARAFVGQAITRASGQQTVHVIVQSQTHHPVSTANGRVTVSFSNGSSTDYYFTTDDSGLGSVSFNFKDQAPGDLVQVDILITYQGLATRTSTSYRIWH
jgi:hypothetical protein